MLEIFGGVDNGVLPAGDHVGVAGVREVDLPVLRRARHRALEHRRPEVAGKDLVAGRVERAGGQVVVPPFEVFDRGRMAVFADPAGASFSVWQPMAMAGAEVFDVPGALSWTELVTPDPESAKVFYELVFGWRPDDLPRGV